MTDAKVSTAAAPPPDHKPYTASNREMHAWGQGSIAYLMLYFPISMGAFLIMEFKFDPILLGIAFCVPRIFDGILDPMIGHLSDITHTRWGRRRPFILGTAFLGSVFLMAIWWMSPDYGQWFVNHAPAGPPWLAHWWATRDWDQTVMFTWLTVCITSLFTCFGTFEMTNNALGYELSDDYNVRTRVFAIYGFYYSLANFALSFVWPLDSFLAEAHVYNFAVIGHRFNWNIPQVFDNTITGIRYISIVMAALAIVSASLVFAGTKERFAKANKTHVKLWPAFKATMRVRPFIIVLLMDVNNNIILGIWGVVAFWIGSLYVFEGDYKLSNQMSIVYTLVGIGIAYLLMPTAVGLTRRLGKRRGLIICASLGLLNAIVLTLIAQPGNKIVWVAWGLLFMPIGSVAGLFVSSLMPDICDVDELNSGERREALFAAVKTFFGKVIRSGMVLASGFILAFTGYEKELQNHQSAQTLHNMIWLGFPCLIAGSVTGLILTCFIPLTAEYMAKVRAELERRRHSGQAQEGISE